MCVVVDCVCWLTVECCAGQAGVCAGTSPSTSKLGGMLLSLKSDEPVANGAFVPIEMYDDNHKATPKVPPPLLPSSLLPPSGNHLLLSLSVCVSLCCLCEFGHRSLSRLFDGKFSARILILFFSLHTVSPLCSSLPQFPVNQSGESLTVLFVRLMYMPSDCALFRFSQDRRHMPSVTRRTTCSERSLHFLIQSHLLLHSYSK